MSTKFEMSPEDVYIPKKGDLVKMKTTEGVISPAEIFIGNERPDGSVHGMTVSYPYDEIIIPPSDFHLLVNVGRIPLIPK